MRIIGGAFRGRALASLGKGDAGAHLRPTTDRVRESLFNILGGGRIDVSIEDARVLDVFCGTGALGLEALSRGAAHVTFVDNGRVALGILAKNIDVCRASDEVEILRADATKLGANQGGKFDLVFLDPPYRRSMGERALAKLMDGGWLCSGALIVWEEAAPIHAPEGTELLDARKFGDTTISFLKTT